VANAPVSASEAQAKANCPTGTVVWVNTCIISNGTHNYETTKQGTYMCEVAAKLLVIAPMRMRVHFQNDPQFEGSPRFRVICK
jgi:hypothetical protein